MNNTRTFEDCVDVGNKVYDLKWSATYIPEFRGDGYNQSNREGYEIDIESIRFSFFEIWLPLPQVPAELYEEMIAGMHRVMASTLED